ncbi:MAG: high-potential iron-sulfur protein [Bdellovibrionota bacterium]
MKRREFFKNLAEISGVAVVAPILFTVVQSQAEESRRKKAASGGSDMVSPDDPVAKAVKYTEASKVAGKDCANFVLFVKADAKGGKEVGTCALFPKKLVVAKGYCNSWAKKA